MRHASILQSIDNQCRSGKLCGGEGVPRDKSLTDIASFEARVSTMDHLCIRASPFDEMKIIEFMNEMGVNVIDSCNRYGSEGVGPSLYVKDPEGNVVELKGPPVPER